MVNASQLSVGYVPVSFPRDPVDFNQFDEHIIVGQILEPLVESDGDGKVAPCIASDWHFSKDGLEISFHINSKKTFSDGKKVSAQDVAYTLRRHMESNSQSKGFLSSIKEIEVIDPAHLKIHLNQKSAAILKALTRDQLGIVPNGWTFKTDSDSPYVGTGPYNLVKDSGHWTLKKNPLFKDFDVPVSEWRLVFFKDSKFSTPDEVPDLLPSMSASNLEKIKSQLASKGDEYRVDTLFGFSQTSFWTDPRGTLYKDVEKRKIAQRFINELIEDNVRINGQQRSTGMIPLGIQGSLEKMPEMPKFQKGSLSQIRIASLGGIFSTYLTESRLKDVKEKYAVQIHYHNFSYLELKELAAWKPDITTGAWAGGFNDPAGFLGLLNVILGMPFNQYLGSLEGQLNRTQREDDWAKRAHEFRTLGAAVIENGLMTPGWRVPFFEVKRKGVQNIQFQTRYTPRLVNFRVAK